MSELGFMLNQVVLPILEGLNSPKSREVRGLIASRDWDPIARQSVDPAHYTNAYEFFSDYQAVSLIKKLEDLPTSYDRRGAALEAFLQSETDCCEANVRLDKFLHKPFLMEESEIRIGEVLSLIRKNIKRILGPFPSWINGRFGPGATTSDPVNASSHIHKLCACPEVTAGAYPLLAMVEDEAWFRYVRSHPSVPYYPRIVRYNRFTTVRKDASKHRGICIEPSLNVYLQLGVLDILRECLKVNGIDLEIGQQLHRELARRGSLTNEVATVDLVGASDRNALILLSLLFPELWADLFRSLRSTHSMYKDSDGNEHIRMLHKISSQGCGFTFDLETIIFFAVGLTSLQLLGITPDVGENISVYGDDIIIDTQAARLCCSILEYLGHKVNEEKSFLDGPFRESCGGDFFEGHDVRPLFIKEVPNFDDPLQVFPLLNQLSAVGMRMYDGVFEASPYYKAWLNVFYRLPKVLRSLQGPVELGDCVIHNSPIPPMEGNYVCEDGITSYLAVTPRTHKLTTKRYGWETQLSAALYGVPSSGIAPRGKPSDYNIDFVPELHFRD